MRCFTAPWLLALPLIVSSEATTFACNPNYKTWEGKNGAKCAEYEMLGWCTSAGDYGADWPPLAGSFEGEAVGGYDARNCPQCGCTAEGGQTHFWLEIYSQTRKSDLFADCQLDSCNIGSGDNFINFDAMPVLPEYHFKLVWDEGTSEDGSDFFMEWKQKNNPLSVTDTDMNPTYAIMLPSHSSPLKFHGLSISSNTDINLLDGTLGNIWNYPIGYRVTYMEQSPKFESSQKESFFAKKSQLFVWAPVTTITPPAEVVDCEVGKCSQLCGGGKKTCQRQCLNGVFGQDVACPSADETKEEDCNQQPCQESNAGQDSTEYLCKVRQEWVEAHPEVTMTSSCPNGEGMYYHVESGKNLYNSTMNIAWLEAWKEKYADEDSTEYPTSIFGYSGAGYLANGELSAYIQGVKFCACFAGCDSVYSMAYRAPTNMCCSDWKEVEAEHCQAHPCDIESKGGCESTCIKDGDEAICKCNFGLVLAADGKACEQPLTAGPTTFNVQLKVQTTITIPVYILTDTSRVYNQIAVDQIKSVFHNKIRDMAMRMSMTLEMMTVLFQQGTNGNSAEAVITVAYSVPADVVSMILYQCTLDRSSQCTLTDIENDILMLTTRVANEAISMPQEFNAISSDAVVTVSSSCVDLKYPTFFDDQADRTVKVDDQFSHSLANGYTVVLTGFTYIRSGYAKGYVKTLIGGLAYATITGLEKNTEYTIDVYQYAASNPGENFLDIGTDNEWKQFFTMASSSEEPTVKDFLTTSDIHGMIFLKFKQSSPHLHFSGLSVSRTKDWCDGLWSAWSPPGACSETCGDGMITKTRVCDGEGCPGADAEQTACNLKECHAGHPCNPNADSWTGSSGMDCSIYEYNGYCTADGKYGNQWGKYWGTWETYAKDGFHAGNCPACGCIKEETTAEVVDCEVGTCSQPCGGGKKTCQRQCLNGVFGQDVACQSADETKEEDCNTQACPSNPCPGSAGGEAHICWDYNAGTGACTFNTNTCRTSLTCSKTAMTITFDKYLFGTENDSPKTAFSTIGTCLTESSPRMDGSFTWTGGFGDCGMEIATEGSFITMKTTLSIGNTDSGITLGGTKIYASGGKTTTVEFKCEYASSATATSDDIDIQAPVDVSASVTKGRGSFATGLSLKHYTDANYNAELTTPIAIGSIVFPMITWEVTTSKIGFYIENCYVIDVTNVDVPNDDDPRIPIILNTCYAGVVSAAISPDRASGLFNHKKVKFSYRSFSFDTASADQQKISCTVQFCTTTTDGSRTCTGDDYIGAKPVVDVSKCPSSTQFNYAL